MSEVTNVLQADNQLITNYDLSKFLLGFNSFVSASLTASGGDVDLAQGQLMGRIASTGLLTPCVASATDGSQYPVGLAIIAQTIADGTTGVVNLVNKGKVDESKIVLSGVETLDTTFGATSNKRTYRDALNDLGLELEIADELTAYDNQ